VTLGNHPAVMLAACLDLGFGDDELAGAGGLLGEPLRVARCETAELLVPAEAEFVLEGLVDGRERIAEGLVSEYNGHYHDYGAGFGVQFLRISHRSDALFQVVLPGLFREHALLGAVSIAGVLEHHLRSLAPNLVGVAVPEAAGGRTAAVVSIHEPRPGQARQLMMAAFSQVPLIKQVTVVDSDVDPWDIENVEWARMVRSHAERDLLVIPSVRTDRSEPLSLGDAVDKLGIDATARDGDRPTGPEVARISPRALELAAALLAEDRNAPKVLSRTLGRSVGRVK
jgi:4-hydroxy-3-polyprenylbenzoate decarboxylase